MDITTSSTIDIRTAFNANYINTDDVGDWMAMIDDRKY